MGNTSSTLIGHGVVGSIFHRRVNTVLALAIGRVGSQGVVNGFIAQPYRLMQRVHGSSIGNIALHSNSVDSNGVDYNRVALTHAGKAQMRYFCHDKNHDK